MSLAEQLAPFIEAVKAAMPKAPPAAINPPDIGVLPPKPYRDGYATPEKELCWCGLKDCHLPFPHRQ